MLCRIQDLRHKEVVCVKDGSLLGPVCDVEFDADTANVLSIVVLGRPRFFGIMGRDDDLVIPWSEIEIIGEDTVLVNCSSLIARRKKRFFTGQKQ